MWTRLIAEYNVRPRGGNGKQGTQQREVSKVLGFDLWVVKITSAGRMSFQSCLKLLYCIAKYWSTTLIQMWDLHEILYIHGPQRIKDRIFLQHQHTYIQYIHTYMFTFLWNISAFMWWYQIFMVPRRWIWLWTTTDVCSLLNYSRDFKCFSIKRYICGVKY